MTGFLMTGLFDFVSYAIGLTRIPWNRFLKALFISIILSNPPIVALGAGLLEGGRVLLVVSLFCIFGLSLISARVRKESVSKNENEWEVKKNTKDIEWIIPNNTNSIKSP